MGDDDLSEFEFYRQLAFLATANLELVDEPHEDMVVLTAALRRAAWLDPLETDRKLMKRSRRQPLSVAAAPQIGACSSERHLQLVHD